MPRYTYTFTHTRAYTQALLATRSRPARALCSPPTFAWASAQSMTRYMSVCMYLCMYTSSIACEPFTPAYSVWKIFSYVHTSYLFIHNTHTLTHTHTYIQDIPLKHEDESNIAWKTFTLRQDYFPSFKLQTEDDITSSVVVPAKALKVLYVNQLLYVCVNFHTQCVLIYACLYVCIPY